MNLQTELNFGGVQETSRIAYHENKEGKKRMVMAVVNAIRKGYHVLTESEKIEFGLGSFNAIPVETLKAVQIATGIEHSSVSGRMNDALRMGLLKYEGEVVFMGRRRKKIVVA